MKQNVVFVGRPGAAARGVRARVEVWQPEDFRLRRLPERSIVVFMADAIRVLDAEQTRATLGRGAARALVCVRGGDEEDMLRAARWGTAGIGHAVLSRRVAVELAALTVPPERPLVPLDRWCPRVPASGSDADRAVRAVSTLARLRPGPWARSLGWSDDRLLSVCKRAFGLSARNTLLCYVAAAHLELRARGTTDDDSSEALGYFDAPTLLRAVERGRRARIQAADLRESAKVTTGICPVRRTRDRLC